MSRRVMIQNALPHVVKRSQLHVTILMWLCLHTAQLGKTVVSCRPEHLGVELVRLVVTKIWSNAYCMQFQMTAVFASTLPPTVCNNISHKTIATKYPTTPTQLVCINSARTVNRENQVPATVNSGCGDGPGMAIRQAVGFKQHQVGSQ